MLLKRDKMSIKNNQRKNKKVPKQKIRRGQRIMNAKKSALAVKGRQTKWAPIWVVLKKYGMGKRIHPSATTAVRRSWRRTKLKIKPRKMRKSHMG